MMLKKMGIEAILTKLQECSILNGTHGIDVV